MLVVGFFLYDQLPVRFKVAFLDVGQGDAIFIQTPEKYQILIDTGATSVITSELGSVMRPWDRSLDLVIITHPDADHFGAIADVARHYSIDSIVDNNFYHDAEFSSYQELVTTYEIQHIVPRDGYVLELSNDARLTFISVPHFGTHDDKNEESIIVRLDYRDMSFLFTGDAGIAVEQELIRQAPELLGIDILKLGHHGSKTSTSGLFLAATQPSLAIISAGADNKYGHPHEGVMSLLDFFGIDSVCTCDHGRIVFTWKSEGLVMKR